VAIRIITVDSLIALAVDQEDLVEVAVLEDSVDLAVEALVAEVPVEAGNKNRL
jgi:hypothetical protein